MQEAIRDTAAADVPVRPSSAGSTRGKQRARTALVDAAMRLLPDRAPSSITGRELAAEAGVNYGLIHHHFGSKDAVLSAGLVALRADFMRVHGDLATLHLLIDDDHPYLRAQLRAQIDSPEPIGVDDDFPIVAAMVESVNGRLAQQAGASAADNLDIESKARAIAMISIQLCYSVFGEAMLDAARVRHRERANVESTLSALYDSLALFDVAAGNPIAE